MRAEQTITVHVRVRQWMVRGGYLACRILAPITPRRWHPAIAEGLTKVIVRYGVVVTCPGVCR